MKLKGGNSNWRGPIWFPTCVSAHRVVDEVRGGATARSSRWTEKAREMAWRLIGIFKRNEAGRRPVFGGIEKFQSDPHWRDYLLFYEHFHGDNGAGLGASHQTGWTA